MAVANAAFSDYPSSEIIIGEGFCYMHCTSLNISVAKIIRGNAVNSPYEQNYYCCAEGIKNRLWSRRWQAEERGTLWEMQHWSELRVRDLLFRRLKIPLGQLPKVFFCFVFFLLFFHKEFHVLLILSLDSILKSAELIWGGNTFIHWKILPFLQEAWGKIDPCLILICLIPSVWHCFLPSTRK